MTTADAARPGPGLRLVAASRPASAGQRRDAAMDAEDGIQTPADAAPSAATSDPASDPASGPSAPPSHAAPTASSPTPTATTSTEAPATTSTAAPATTSTAAPAAEAPAPPSVAGPDPQLPAADAGPTMTVAEAAPLAASYGSNQQSGKASWYSTRAGSCAHTNIPKGTMVQVTNTITGATTSCLVDDYGPTDRSRIIDLSWTSFSQIADPSQGLVPVQLQW